MQTAKEFLDEERETILATEIEANEYLLSCLSESIIHIREDFDALNKTQMQQLENEYAQLLQTFEEYFTTEQTIDELTSCDDKSQSTYKQLEDEYQLASQELTKLNNHNQLLLEQVLVMVCSRIFIDL